MLHYLQVMKIHGVNIQETSSQRGEISVLHQNYLRAEISTDVTLFMSLW